jgi:serine/threonine protein kinase
VAVKVIERRLLANDIQKEMLLEEINILKSIEHRNIIRCYDVLHTQNNTYIITEYCNEGDLSQTLSRHSRLQEQDLVNILKDIISGFLYLAENGIVHRDLKPANLFIRDGVVKIGDFGFAKRVEAAPRSSENVGTPFYMAPEALKDSVYSIKSDIFAIGALTY